jgi:hypothetical protein
VHVQTTTTADVMMTIDNTAQTPPVNRALFGRLKFC